MKKTEENDQSKPVPQSDPARDIRNGGARKDRNRISVGGGAGAAGQIPIKGNDSKLKYDPLAPDVPEQDNG